RQAQTFAFMTREVAEQLHQQILIIEDALGLNADDDEDEHEEQSYEMEEKEQETSSRATERESATFSPTFAQALKQLNELARQRLGEPSTTGASGSESEEVPTRTSSEEDEDADALEQLQDAFTQMMEVVRELAEEMSTDALKITGRFKCARTHIEFIPRAAHHEDDDDDDDDDDMLEITSEGGVLNLEVELVMVLQLFEEGRSRVDDLPAVELQLEVEDFERLHATLDYSLERERRSRRRRS
ncbi:MAG TPA: hypothetical protein VH593_28570, partial [Ktedonobacteraceae bacterium]